MSNLDPRKVLKDFQDRAEFMLNADKHLAEVVSLLKDTHDVLNNLAAVVLKLTGMINDIESRVGSVTSVLDRLDRLEVAAFNIERATLGVEGAMSALPKALRSRVQRSTPKAQPEP